jgi:hypothetical protein
MNNTRSFERPPNRKSLQITRHFLKSVLNQQMHRSHGFLKEYLIGGRATVIAGRLTAARAASWDVRCRGVWGIPNSKSSDYLVDVGKYSNVPRKAGLDIREAPAVDLPRFRFTLTGLAGFVLVGAIALTPISDGIRFNTFSRSYYRAVAGIFAVAALRSRVRERAFWLGFAASGTLCLLASALFGVPSMYGRPTYGLVFAATWAMAFGILGGLLTRRYRNPAG